MNIHGFREQDNDTDQRDQSLNLWRIYGDSLKRFPILGAQGTITNYRTINYFKMLHYKLFPGYQFISITTLVLFLYAIIFVLCVMDGIEKQGEFLEISDAALLSKGGLVTGDIKNHFKYQQLFTSIFLSRNFYEYFSINFYLLILLSSFEYASGPLIALLLYILSGAIGALFGSAINCCNDIIYTHAQTGLCGLAGALFACVILNWKGFEAAKEIRTFFCCIMWVLITFLLILILSSTNGVNHYDKYGSIGGLITGFFLCLAIVPPIQQGEYEDKAKIFGWTFTGILTLLSILLIIVI